MMVVADTRKGNPIWIDWTFDHSGKICPTYQDFDSAEENYDAMVVFEYMVLRAISKKEGFVLSFVYSDASRNYRKRLIAGHSEMDLKISLGSITTKARTIYARSLLRAEFRD